MSKYRVKLFSGERIVEADTWDLMNGGSIAFRDEQGNAFLVFNHRVWSEVEMITDDEEN